MATSTVTLASTDDAQSLAQLVAGATTDGATVALSADALDTLAALDDEHDGHFDGTYIWIGGSEYPVALATEVAGQAYRITDHDDALRIYGDFLGQAAETIDRVFADAADSVVAMQIGEHRRGEINRPRSCARALVNLQTPELDVQVDLDTVTATHDPRSRWTADEVADLLARTLLDEQYVRTTVVAAIQHELGIAI